MGLVKDIMKGKRVFKDGVLSEKVKKGKKEKKEKKEKSGIKDIDVKGMMNKSLSYGEKHHIDTMKSINKRRNKFEREKVSKEKENKLKRINELLDKYESVFSKIQGKETPMREPWKPSISSMGITPTNQSATHVQQVKPSNTGMSFESGGMRIPINILTPSKNATGRMATVGRVDDLSFKHTYVNPRPTTLLDRGLQYAPIKPQPSVQSPYIMPNTAAQQ